MPKAYLSPEGGFSCDFVTVNPYLGADGIKPFAELAGEYGRGLYVLVKTSTLGVELQDQPLADGRKVYELMADLVSHWGGGLIGSCGYSAVGAVVGATWPGRIDRPARADAAHPLPCAGLRRAGAPPARISPDALTRTGAARWSMPPGRCSARTRSVPELGWLEATRAEAVRMREDITAGFSGRGRTNEQRPSPFSAKLLSSRAARGRNERALPRGADEFCRASRPACLCTSRCRTPRSTCCAVDQHHGS